MDNAVVRYLRLFGLAWMFGVLLTVIMVVLAVQKHLPVRDPDDTMLRFPAILLGPVVQGLSTRLF